MEVDMEKTLIQAAGINIITGLVDGETDGGKQILRTLGR
jgi:hypothetical protein